MSTGSVPFGLEAPTVLTDTARMNEPAGPYAGMDRYELAFPKGRVESGEDPLAAAAREIREETGYAAGRLQHLQTVTLAPGYLRHTTHIVLARDLYRDPLPGDEPEPIEVVPWPLDRIDELLGRDDFTEARSIAALYRVRDLLRDEQNEGEPGE